MAQYDAQNKNQALTFPELKAKKVRQNRLTAIVAGGALLVGGAVAAPKVGGLLSEGNIPATSRPGGEGANDEQKAAAEPGLSQMQIMAEKPDAATEEYVVQPGDTAWELAKERLPKGADPRPLVDEIQEQANGQLDVGEQLELPPVIEKNSEDK